MAEKNSASPRVRARVIVTAERTIAGWIVGVCGGLGMLFAVCDPFGLFWRDHPYFFVGLSLMTWGLGALLGHRPRARVVDLTEDVRGIHAGAIIVPNNARARIAKGARGASVAMSWGNGAGALFEVERIEDARTLVAMANADLRVPVQLRLRFDLLRWVTRAFAFAGMMSGMGYAIAVGILGDSDFKGTFGLPALLTLIAASLCYLASQFVSWRAMVGEPGSRSDAMGALGRHLALHKLDEAKRIARDDVAEEESPDAGARVRVMIRGNDTTRAWLARVDHAGAAAEGYRSDAPTREELLGVLDDSAASTDLRLAAARVLVRKHGEDARAIGDRLEPDLAPYLLRVVDEDPDRAARSLDALGPAFRAK